FHQISSFGKSAIRRFPSNISEVRQQTARTFEDILQCAIPAFEGLLPSEHDAIIRTLLFRLAQWHALAKLRIHTDDSLQQLEEATRLLGRQLRKFRDFTCSAFKTMELPSEATAQRRRQENKISLEPTQTTSVPTTRQKTFNLSTYKLHALGDYVNSIRTFGTTDSYTTQIVGHLMASSDRRSTHFKY
ncbi:hypothetical protein M404DRAFT_156554, partial [Pisolithus tinctorius Marx 270]